MRVLFFFLFCSWIPLSAQFSPQDLDRVDSLFRDWNSPDHPGGVVAIAIKSYTSFSKGLWLSQPGVSGAQLNGYAV